MPQIETKGMTPRKLGIALDETYQPYYGKDPNACVHDYKPVKGARGCYKFIVVSIVAYSKKFILFTLPAPKIHKPRRCYVEELITFVHSHLNIELVLLDRGFYDMEVIDYLYDQGLNFIILAPKLDTYRKIMAKGSGIYKYSTVFAKGKTTAKISFLFTVVLEYLGYDWLFATNIRFEDVRTYVHLYKTRWGIETIFRVQDEVEIKSQSKLMEVRYFLFAVESLLYNLWVFFSAGVSFSVFILANYLTVLVELLIDVIFEVRGLESGISA